MKTKILLLCAVASVLFCAGASAQNDGRYWVATENEELYCSMLDFMAAFHEDMAGESTCYLVQDAIMRIKAAHVQKPYEWISQVEDFCLMMESIYPPCVSHPQAGSSDRYETIRRDILRLYDYPVHVCSSVNTEDKLTPPAEQADKFISSIVNHLNVKRDFVFDFLDSARPAGNELQLIKVYSSGFVLRTSSACVGFDICYNFAFGDVKRVDELVEKLDALFITHAHSDHFDYTLAYKMLSAGKKVVMPTDLVAAFTGPDKLVWKDGQDALRTLGAGVSASGKMSAQGSEPCLLYYVDLDGWKIIHNGDNSIHDNETFFESRDRADIIFADFFGGFTTSLQHFMASPNPSEVSATYVTTHGNEYHHSVYRRVGYHYMYFNNTALGSQSFGLYPNYVGLDDAECLTFTRQ